MTETRAPEQLALPERLRGVDLNLVVAFDALAREASVTRAARRVGVTQSAMSHALRRLRALLRDPVLVRTGSGMALTARAEALVAPMQSGLMMLGRALLGESAFDPQSARRAFTVAAPDLFDVLVMPPLLSRVRDEAPGIDLKLLAVRGRTLNAKLETGEIDIGVVARFDGPVRDQEAAPGLVRRTLFRDGFACFLRAGHAALAIKRGRPSLSLARYLTVSHVLVSPSGAVVGPIDEALAQRDQTRRVALTVPHFTAALAIVAQSDLVLTAPLGLARLLSPGLGVVMAAAPLPLPEHAVDLVWHERFSSDPGQRWLRELVTEMARGMNFAPPRAPS
jgi:DNA-binding transcriptional LysR family regulator